jgi:DNA-binding response OmpR family regulator
LQAIEGRIVRSDHRILLVIDNDHETVSLYARGLRARRFSPVTVTGSEEAVRLASTCEPVVIVADLLIAARHDFRLIRQLRRDIRVHTPILLLTELTSPAMRQHARDVGCDRFLLKAGGPEALAAELRDILLEVVAPPQRGIPHVW